MRLGTRRERGFGRVRQTRGVGMGVRRWLPALLLLWLVIGAIAAGQRGYFTDAEANCATTGTVVVTVVAGPLNYLGANPKVADCHMPEMPQPSP
jgi:hypothetical protein